MPVDTLLPTGTPLPADADAPPPANAAPAANAAPPANGPPVANVAPAANAAPLANTPSPASTPARPEKRGYQKLALLMTSQEDMAMFRRFTNLNMLNLMSLQSELMELENDVSVIWERLELSEHNTPYSVNFNLLRKKGESLNAHDNTTRDEPPRQPKDWSELLSVKLMEVRAKLNEYSKQELGLTVFYSISAKKLSDDTLLKVAKVSALSEPEKESVNQLRRWLGDTKYGKAEIDFSERKAWEEHVFSDDRHAPDDLVAVRTTTEEQAPFSAWASGGLLTLFHETCGFKLRVSSIINIYYPTVQLTSTFRDLRQEEILRQAGRGPKYIVIKTLPFRDTRNL